MTSVEQIRNLFEDVGPELDVQGVLQTEDDQWALVYDDQIVVEISHEVDRKCLTLGAELGEPAEEDLLETYRSLLAYSALGDRTGGIRIALEAPYGSVVQLLDLFTEDLDLVTLISVLDNFVEKVRTWRELLAAGGISPEDVPDAGESRIPPGIRA